MWEKISSELHDFSFYNGRKKRLLSRMEIQVGAFVRYIQTHEIKIFEQYHAFVESRFSDMWCSVQSLYAQLSQTASAITSRTFVNKNEFALRSYLAFDPTKRGTKTIRIYDAAQVEYEIREYLLDYFA